MSARSGLAGKRTSWPHLEQFRSIFPWTENTKTRLFCDFPWCANGCQGDALPIQRWAMWVWASRRGLTPFPRGVLDARAKLGPIGPPRKINKISAFFGFGSVYGKINLKWPQMGPGSVFPYWSRPCRQFRRHGFLILIIYIFCFFLDPRFPDFWISDSWIPRFEAVI